MLPIRMFGLAIIILLSVLSINLSEKLRTRSINKLDSLLLAFPAYLIIAVLCQLGDRNDPTVLQIGLTVLAMLCLIPPVRKLIARLLPIDPYNRIHTAALLLTFLTMIVLFKNPDINEGLRNSIDNTQDINIEIFYTWLEAIFRIGLSFLGVGLLVRRNWRESCQRLGLVKPALNQIWRGVLFSLIHYALWHALEQIITALGYTPDIETTELAREYMSLWDRSIWSIITVGFAAGIGEEILYRGAFLPRLGIICSSLLFAAAHTQYGISLTLLDVFLGGLVLALVRRRYNTNTAIIMHAAHNILVTILSS